MGFSKVTTPICRFLQIRIRHTLVLGLGGTEFRRELLEQMAGAMGEHHDGEERWETAEAVAERIVGEELTRLGWRDNDLANRSKGDPGKVATGQRQVFLPGGEKYLSFYGRRPGG